MRSSTILLIIGLVLAVNSAIEPVSPCGKYEIYTEDRGCITSCKDPSFLKCGDVFPAIWDPKFCALLKDGTWKNYTFSCQACQNPDVLGVDNGVCGQNQKPVQTCKNNLQCAQPEVCLTGVCFNICKTTKCPGGSVCVHGQCIPQKDYCRSNADCKNGEKCQNGVCRDKCWEIKCKPDQTCVNGKCEKSLAVCPADAPYNVVYCSPPRPNEKTCPTVVYVREPDPLVCGVTATGERKNFPRECEAYKDKTVLYYFDKPCHKAPFVCEKRENCLGYYCQSRGCKNSQECPYDWQACFNNKCLDKCTFLKCASCKFGRCAYEQPNGKCTTDSDCQRDYWSCVGFECADLCEKKECGPRQTCKKGICYPSSA